MELRRPKITKAEWEDSEGKEVNKSLVGQTLKLHAETKDVGDGAGVTFTVYDKYKRGVYSVGAHVEKGIAEAEWTYQYTGEKLTEKPKFTFEVTGQRCKILESPEIEMGARIRFSIVDILDNKPETYKIYLITPDGSKEEINLADDCSFEKDDIIPGKYIIIAEKKDNE